MGVLMASTLQGDYRNSEHHLLKQAVLRMIHQYQNFCFKLFK